MSTGTTASDAQAEERVATKLVGWTASVFEAVEPNVEARRRHLRALGVSPTIFDQPDNRMSVEVDRAIWRRLIGLCPREELVPLAASKVKGSHLGLAGFLCMAAATIGDGLRLHAKYRLLLGDDALSLIRDEHDNAVVVLASPCAGEMAPALESLFATYTQAIRAWSQAPVFPAFVDFKHAQPSDPSYLSALFGDNVRFDAPRNAIAFSADDCARPLRTANPELREYLEGVARRRLGEETGNCSERVWAVLFHADAHARPDLAQVAKQLGMSARTLQRRLADDGLRFQDIVDDVAHTRAVELLGEPELSVAEIADRLGFGETRAFSRAFRRWTGVSPTNYRQSRA